jgi:exodeoxyribonuclease-3
MRILSWNVNGIRAAARKGFLDFLKKDSPDILGIQEIKADIEDVPKEVKDAKGYHTYFFPAEKKGYSGTGIFTKIEPENVKYGLGKKDFDKEGRTIILEFPDFTLLNLYIPNGRRDKSMIPFKLKMYEYLFKRIEKIHNPILIGDFNIAHKEIDLARPKENRNNTMFTKDEREVIDKVLELGFSDTFRESDKGGGNYTWWPYFVNARTRNLGWRIDYIFVQEKMMGKVKDAFILPEVMGSDHCPIGLEIYF